MKLRAWREGEGLSRREVAEQLSTDTATIYRWELDAGHSDKRIPTVGFMGRIHQLSRGAVAPNDFYDLPPIDQLELPIERGDDAPTLFERPEPAPVHDDLQAVA